MIKELEALERLAMPDELHISECKKLGISPTQDYEIIKQLLQRLESIDNANPSEALECLEWLIKNYIGNDYYKYEEELSTIKQALLKAQENARLKEILINGFKDKNGVFHKQTYLAFIDDEWCICDLKTDEWFLVKEVLE